MKMGEHGERIVTCSHIQVHNIIQQGVRCEGRGVRDGGRDVREVRDEGGRNDNHLLPTFRYTTLYSRGLGIAGTDALLNLAWNPMVTRTNKQTDQSFSTDSGITM